jgi:uncharacterized iron-regulated protein
MHVTHVALRRATTLACAVSLAALCACSSFQFSPPPIKMSVDKLAERFADFDVGFVGEEHDNTVGHVQQLQLLKALHQRRPKLALAMEMFERDVQPVIDAYLAGEIDEKQFLAESRPWSNYQQDYRPLVEYCKAHGLRVIASNAPTPLARKVSRGELLPTQLDSPHVARSTTAPRDSYWRKFKNALGGDDDQRHGEMSPEMLLNFYRAQCLKDDTMAESIADFLQGEGAGTYVLHINGVFHSEDRLGAVSRLQQRMPELQIGIVSMVSFGLIRPTGVRDYEMLVPPQPKKFEHTEQPSDGDAMPADHPPIEHPSLDDVTGEEATEDEVMEEEEVVEEPVLEEPPAEDPEQPAGDAPTTRSSGG